MEFGYCNLSIVPLRSDPYEQSEMISQVLFGELLIVNEQHNNWCRVKLVDDGYEGWISNIQFQSISEAVYMKLSNMDFAISNELVQLLINKSQNTLTPIILGSTLHGINKNNFHIEQTEYSYMGEIKYPRNIKTEELRGEVTNTAKLFLNAPYLWGGKSPFGIDCSGFTQIVYKINGIQLQRDSSQQANQGETINFLSEAKAGDLIFFDNEDGEIIHTGLLLDQNRIIHSSGKVRIDQIDHEGIYNAEIGSYSHKLRIIKKLL